MSCICNFKNNALVCSLPDDVLCQCILPHTHNLCTWFHPMLIMTVLVTFTCVVDQVGITCLKQCMGHLILNLSGNLKVQLKWCKMYILVLISYGEFCLLANLLQNLTSEQLTMKPGCIGFRIQGLWRSRLLSPWKLKVFSYVLLGLKSVFWGF